MLPNIPTDTLYKFITMTGVIIVVFCLWTLRDNIVREAEIIALSDNVSVETQQSTIEGRQAQMAAERENMNKSPIVIENSPTKQSHAAESDKKMDDAQTVLSQHIQKDQVSEIERKARMERYARLHFQTAIEFWLCTVGVVIGFVFTAYGFRLWYTKQQKYLDIILVAQSLAPQTTPATPSPTAAP